MSLGVQLVWLFTLAIPVACVAWTVTHEELFREPREYAVERSTSDPRFLVRKFFYLVTCEYCFSHYVALGAVLITGFHLLLDDWRGTFIAWLAVVWVANQYMGIHGRLRVGIKNQRTETRILEERLGNAESSNAESGSAEVKNAETKDAGATGARAPKGQGAA